MGDRFMDHCESIRLNKEIINFCEKILMPGGTLLMKVIRGPYEPEMSEHVLEHFKDLEKVKPVASR